MKKVSTFLLILLGLSISFMSCDRGDDEEDVIVEPSKDNEVSGNITANTTWKAKDKYILKGFVYVEAGATLTIEPGTIIKGDKATKGTLIVKPGGKIIADGTAAKPIVFTSIQAKGQRNYGDWGGIILLGKANVNKTPATIEGENLSTFGGTDNADNSGVLRYVRIEFAGIAFETDKEINGLTMGGVGSGTVIDYVQVSYTGDDAFEWFGGTVNAKHLISYRNLDDDMDTDWGFSGKVQHVYIFRDPKVADQCSCSDSNGFESDNDASGSDAKPQTSAQFANVTAIMGEGTPDAKYRSALRIRRNSAISVFNSVFVGAWTAKGGLELEGTASQNNFKNGLSDYKGLVLSGMTKPIVSGDEALLKETGRANQFGVATADLKLAATYAALFGKPGLLPQTGSVLLSGGVTLPTGFESTTYRGAFSTTDWTDGWANFDPQNTEY